ncbi:MAG: nitronate monooxygenase [Rhodobacteraceae bacterium]|nr:nitronate monooxygenase [Paracoccaceae bacterium]
MSLLDAPQVRRFLALTGQRLPVMQAPVGSAASPALAAAVARAGGLGGLAITWTGPADSAEAIRRAGEGAEGGVLFANFVLHFPCENFEAVLATGIPVVTLSWGIDAGRIDRAKRAGARVGVQVGNAAGARKARAAGADFLIAQGVEAGGHVQSTTPLAALLPAVLQEAGDLPVLAAGGIATGAAIARAIGAGAAGAVLGTRFVATREASAHDDYKAALVAAGSGDTVLTGCFNLGWPDTQSRVLRNDTLTEWESEGCPQAPGRPGEGDIVFRVGEVAVPRYSDTAPVPGAVGAIRSACLYAGTGVGEIAAVEPADELVRRLWREAEAADGGRMN